MRLQRIIGGQELAQVVRVYVGIVVGSDEPEATMNNTRNGCVKPSNQSKWRM
jgi:hypothetical protein